MLAKHGRPPHSAKYLVRRREGEMVLFCAVVMSITSERLARSRNIDDVERRHGNCDGENDALANDKVSNPWRDCRHSKLQRLAVFVRSSHFHGVFALSRSELCLLK